MTPSENRALDIKIVQKDRAQTAGGYPFKTFDEMACEEIAKRWLIKGVFARGGILRMDCASGRDEICLDGSSLYLCRSRA